MRGSGHRRAGNERHTLRLSGMFACSKGKLQIAQNRGLIAAEFETRRVDLRQGDLFECSMSSMSIMSSSERPLKKVKVEHEPDGPLGCPFLL